MKSKNTLIVHSLCLLLLLSLSSCGSLSRSLYSSIFGYEPKDRQKISKKENIKIAKMSQTLNSESSETAPVISADGKTLYFARSSGSNLFDFKVFEAELRESEFQNPTKMGTPPNINDQNYIGSATSDNQSIVFTANEAAGFSSDNNKIYFAKKKDGNWTITEELDFFPDKKGWGFNILSGEFDVKTGVMYQNPFVSADGTKLFFSCNLVDGLGANDLYVSEKGVDGSWQKPQNLGNTINTKYNEMSPFLHPDNKTLYFVSNGHPGIGKLDVYRSVNENGKWTKPELLGEPISSPAVEIYFTTDAAGEIAYFTSDRIKEADSDIYSTPLPKSYKPAVGAVIMLGKVKDGITGKPLEAEVLVENLETGKLIAKLQSDFHTGEYSVSLPKGKEYALSVRKAGYTFYSTNLTVEKNTSNKEIKRNFELFAIKSGTKLVLNNLFFDTGSSVLKDASKLELERAVNILNRYKEYKVKINGHTDNVGNESSNKTLSKNRANSVKDYLVKQGISSSRLSCQGFGESDPIATNETAEGRKQNRRVEIVFE